MRPSRLIATSCVLAMAVLSLGQTNTPLTNKLAIDQKLGAQVPLDAQFKDEHGKQVAFGSMLNGRPVLLMPIFYSCQGVCSLELNGILKTATRMKNTYRIGEKFDIVAVSIKPTETPDLALAKEKELQEAYKVPGTENGWHLLTGDAKEIRRVTDAVGFKYEWNPETGVVNHPAGVMILTPQGQISSYIYGAEFPTKILEQDIDTAGKSKIGAPAEVILLGCVMVDPITGKRTIVVENVMKLTGMLTVLILGLSILKMSLASRGGGRVNA